MNVIPRAAEQTQIVSPSSSEAWNGNYEVSSNALAAGWIKVTQKAMDVRLAQLRKIGLSEDEIAEQIGDHYDALAMIRGNIDSENEEFIRMFAQYEKQAIENAENMSNYHLNHITQLDGFVFWVRELAETQIDTTEVAQPQQ